MGSLGGLGDGWFDAIDVRPASVVPRARRYFAMAVFYRIPRQQVQMSGCGNLQDMADAP
jgi:hypothetical protein